MRKLKGGTKGTGNRGRNLFIKRVDEAVSQIKKQISSRSTAIEANRAEYRRFKDLVSVAEAEEREAKKSLDDGSIDDAAFQQVKKRADKARKALGDFDTRTSYTKQSAELDDLRKQASQLGALGDQAARKFNSGLWDKLAEQRVLSGESYTVRRGRKIAAEQAKARSKKQAEDLIREAKKQAAQKQREEEARILRVLSEREILDLFLPVYQNTKLFKEHFTKFAKSAGVRNRSVEDYNNPTRIPYQDVVTLLNYVSENDPGGYLKNLWDTNQLETPETLRQQAKPR